MTTRPAGSTPREIATFVLPGAAGIGIGAFLALLVTDWLPAVAVLAVVGAVAGHGVGYLLLE